jgi:hypothetical protein
VQQPNASSSPHDQPVAIELIERAVERLDRFHRDGNATELHSSIADLRIALDIAGLSALERAWAQGVLAQALIDRFEVTTRRADIDEAINCARAAATATDVDGQSRAGQLRVLASAHGVRYQALGDPEDLQCNLTVAEAALAACTDPEERPLHRSTLAGAYSRRR